MNDDSGRHIDAAQDAQVSPAENLPGTGDSGRDAVGRSPGRTPAPGDHAWRDGFGAYGFGESGGPRGLAGPPSGYGARDFGAGETHGGRRGGDAERDPGRPGQARGPGPSEAPWTQSQFAGRGEFGHRERGTWNDERGHSAGTDTGPGTARGERWNVPGPHTGRGPENYQRSGTAIHDDVCERLTRHGHLDASRIRVRVEHGEVILEGLVDSRLARRMAEDAAETVSGVRDVHNRLRIQASEHDRDRTEGRSDR